MLINIWKIIIIKLVVLWTEFKTFFLVKSWNEKKRFFLYIMMSQRWPLPCIYCHVFCVCPSLVGRTRSMHFTSHILSQIFVIVNLCIIIILVTYVFNQVPFIEITERALVAEWFKAIDLFVAEWFKTIDLFVAEWLKPYTSEHWNLLSKIYL